MPLLRWTKEQSVLVPVFFALLFLVSLVGFRAYGISWDEPNMTNVGEYAYNYVFRGQPWAAENAQRFYGTAFEMLLATIRNVGEITSPRSIFLMRHLVTFWFFVAGVYFFYRLVSHRFRRWQFGLFGALLLVLSPRIFADAFYNSKDIPAMVSFVISMYTMALFLEKKTWKRLLWHALATGLVIGIRITGAIVPAFTIFFLLIHTARDVQENNDDLTQYLPQMVAYVIGSLLATIALWPFLWEHALSHFLEAYRFMSTIGIDTFYMGQQIHHLPWHYVFVWIGITTPWLYVIAFLGGLMLLMLQCIRHPLRFLGHQSNDVLTLLWFFVPILAVYVSGAGIFDGWRHLYFIYPAFLLIGLTGIDRLWMALKNHGQVPIGLYGKWIIVALFALQSVYLAVWMIVHHPVQNVYFSIPAKLVQGNFELDYWGLSFREGIEYVLAHDARPQVSMYFNSSPGFSTLNILRDEDRARIVVASSEENAEYFLSNYRFHYKEDYPYEPLKIFTVDGVRILGVYRVGR